MEPTTLGGLTWYARVGLVSNGLQNTRVVTLDGVSHLRNMRALYGSLGWWADRQRIVYMEAAGGNPVHDEFELEPKMLMRRPTGETCSAMNLRSYVRLPNRRLTVSGTTMQSVVGDGALTVEFSGLPWNGFKVGPGRSPTEVFVSMSAGGGLVSGIFYNTVTKELVGPQMHVGVAEDLVFASDHGVMVSYQTNPAALCVWSLEVEPANLSVPVVIAGEAKAGHVTTYEVRLTGTQNEPCPNELIDWGVVGMGRLEDSQSKTDDDGRAITRVVYGVDDDGDSTVKASVRC